MKYIEFKCTEIEGAFTLVYYKYKYKANGEDEVLTTRPLAVFNSEVIGCYITEMLNYGRNVIDSMERINK